MEFFTPSNLVLISFTSVVALVIGSSIWVYAQRDKQSAIHATVALGFWLAFNAALSLSGVLEGNRLPPPIAFYLAPLTIGAVIFAFSRFGTRLSNATFAALILFQAFRFPLELVLHQMHTEGVLPVQMTFSGSNFDIVTGVSALIVGGLALQKRAPRLLIWVWNVVGFVLLLIVIGIAVLSSPIPLRQFMNDPPVVLVFFVPYTWIVSVCVTFALIGHLVVFRKLIRGEEL